MSRLSRLLAAVLVLLAAELVSGTSDASIKRRVQRFASMAERMQEEAAAGVDVNSTIEGEGRYFEHPLGADLSEYFGDSNLTHVRQRANITYHQCMYQAQRYLKLGFSNFDEMSGEFLDIGGNATLNTAVTPLNPCGLQWIPRSELFSGVDKVILVGDSTILRDFWYIIHAPHGVYGTKVAELQRVSINTTLRLSSGRLLPVIFFRLLYASVIDSVLSDVFNVATRNSLILFSLGPHDTSWLIFDKTVFKQLHAMPGMHVIEQKNRRQSKAGIMSANMRAAQMYWEKYSTLAVNKIGKALQRFEQSLLDTDPAAKTYAFRRPVVVFREQFLPKCSDPKYATNPHTKCVTWLKPIIVPFMRAYLRSRLLTINIPTVSMDWVAGRFTHICFLQDAGHLPRRCKNVELNLVVTAFRQARRYALLQGFALDDQECQTELIPGKDKVAWHQVANLPTMLRPPGVTHYDPRIGKSPPPQLSFGPLVVPSAVLKLPDYKQLMDRFDDPAFCEREASKESDFSSHTSLAGFNESSSNTTEAQQADENKIVSGGSDSGAAAVGGGSDSGALERTDERLNVSLVKSSRTIKYDIHDDTTTMILFVFGVFSFAAIVGYRRSFKR
jgi:hypothetical protein